MPSVRRTAAWWAGLLRAGALRRAGGSPSEARARESHERHLASVWLKAAAGHSAVSDIAFLSQQLMNELGVLEHFHREIGANQDPT